MSADNKQRPTPSSAVTGSGKKPKPSPFATKKRPEKLDMERETGSLTAPPLRNTVTKAVVNPKDNSISYICLKTPNVEPMQKNDEGEVTVQNPGMVVVLGHGYTERLLTQPYYNRNPNTAGYHSKYLDFMNSMGCHQKVYKLLDPRKDGKEYMIRKYQDKRVPGVIKETNCQGIAIGIPNGATWEGCIKDFHDDTVVPAIQLLKNTPICKSRPYVNDNDEQVFHIPYLSMVLDDSDICDLVAAVHASYEDEAEGPTSLDQFFKLNKGNLYMCWAPGSVPLNYMKDFQLGEEHLHEADWKRLQAANNIE
jgi:hypothetical protein